MVMAFVGQLYGQLVKCEDVLSVRQNAEEKSCADLNLCRFAGSSICNSQLFGSVMANLNITGNISSTAMENRIPVKFFLCNP